MESEDQKDIFQITAGNCKVIVPVVNTYSCCAIINTKLHNLP